MVPETFTENFYIIGCGSLHLQPIKYGNNLVMNFHSCEADTPLEQKSLQIMFMAEREVVQSSCSPSVCLWADFSLYTKCRSTVHFQASRCQAHDPTSLNPKPIYLTWSFRLPFALLFVTKMRLMSLWACPSA